MLLLVSCLQQVPVLVFASKFCLCNNPKPNPNEVNHAFTGQKLPKRIPDDRDGQRDRGTRETEIREKNNRREGGTRGAKFAIASGGGLRAAPRR